VDYMRQRTSLLLVINKLKIIDPVTYTTNMNFAYLSFEKTGLNGKFKYWKLFFFVCEIHVYIFCILSEREER